MSTTGPRAGAAPSDATESTPVKWNLADAWEQVAVCFPDSPALAVIPREEATVGALRDRSTDVDTSTVSRREWRARYEADPTYELADA